MTKSKKLELKANKITGLEEQKVTPTPQEEITKTKSKKKKATKGKAGPKKQNGANWKKSMIQLDPQTKKQMLQQIAASDTIKTQSVFIDKAIKHYIKYLKNN